MAMLKPIPADGDRPARPKRRRLKNVPVLPTLLTLGNLLCGFTAIYFCMRVVFGIGANIDPSDVRNLRGEHLERLLPSFLAMSAWCVFLGMVFDAFDGFAARLQRKAGSFGIQLDSLADIVTFGVAPAFLVITLLMQGKHDWPTPLTDDRIGRVRWMLIFVYTACAAIRLARFNVETTVDDASHRGFKGLPSPAAAGMIASLIILHERLYFLRTPTTLSVAGVVVAAMPFVTVAVALLMVSRFDYTHLINVYLRGKRPIGYVVLTLALLFVFLWQPEITIASGLTLYALTGPVRRAGHFFHGTAPQPAASSGSDGTEGDISRTA